MPDRIAETMAALAKARERSSSVLVSFSGGKDSLCTLDLCTRAFKHVECFFMYLVPGLACVEEALSFATRRYGVKIHQVPHWLVANIARSGVYCDSSWRNDSLPEWKLRDIYDCLTAETKIRCIAVGAKRADSRWRRWNMHKMSVYDDIVYPIAGWSKFDTLGYLKTRGIPLPDTTRAGPSTGLDLSRTSVLWLHQNYPEDAERLFAVYPYAEAIVWREKFYGGAAP